MKKKERKKKKATWQNEKQKNNNIGIATKPVANKTFNRGIFRPKKRAIISINGDRVEPRAMKKKKQEGEDWWLVDTCYRRGRRRGMEGWKRSVRAEWREREREREKKARVAMVTKLLITFIWPEMTRGDPAVFFFFFFFFARDNSFAPGRVCLSSARFSITTHVCVCMCVYTRVGKGETCGRVRKTLWNADEFVSNPARMDLASSSGPKFEEKFYGSLYFISEEG